jgi:tetratricopeptide (TPR) repeat protein
MASTAALGAEALAAVDTAVLAEPTARAELGQAYYRLARSYNEMGDWSRAIPAFEVAARYVPGTFTEAISDFFIGTSYDRLGDHDKAVPFYRRSFAHPSNSQRGYRCARQAEVYPFRFVPGQKN